MKNSLSIITILLIGFAMIFASACHKTNNGTTFSKGILYLHLHTDIDTNETDSGVVKMDSSGRMFQLDIAQFYISGIVLTKSDGSTVSLSKDYILKNIATEQYYIDSIPTGNYTTISFNVGVDAATNAMSPSGFASSSVLSPQTPSMWFGSTSQGYIFMNIQGFADTSSSMTAPANQPLNYQIGGNTLLRTITMPVHNPVYTVTANQATFIHIICDYGKALRGVNFKTQNIANLTTNPAVATQIANNIPTMFRYEE